MPNICYWCGQLDHGDKECILWIESTGTLSSDHRQFDQSLRATLYRSYNKPVVFVPSYHDGAKGFGDKNRPDGGERPSDTVEDNYQGRQFESILDMELDNDGEVEEDSINIPLSIPSSDMETLTKCNSKIQKSLTSGVNYGETG